MRGHSRSKNGVLSHAYDPRIHVVRRFNKKDVDGRDKPGHDKGEAVTPDRRIEKVIGES